ncbi:F0F1 ATP synthase subunit A [Paraliomyxa miuraensis]|uniref:F0F1 ATP synthase subunit A n=1 Tax=Paraliomyxa miuraensis TaxID=376150 RepID=UPI002254F2E2|nr:F0F1 ATP synthase subunit A [Paraliomyxa miuraensis]MCX4244899.1 F0F1 ATP synthase subunit A [Paraliomyxa miuraensis]
MNEVFVLRVLGLQIPDTVVVSLGLTLVLVAVAWPLSRRLRAHGLSAWQTALETYVGWVRSTVGELLGEDPTPYVPLIGTLVGFIALSNLLTIVPVIRPPTADLDTAAGLALVVFLAVPYYGIRRHGVRGYLRKYLEPHPLLMPLNVLGELTRTLALAVRLFGNVMSGQMVGAILLVIAGAVVPVPLMALSILTGLVQAYIFGILATVYIAAAVQAQQGPESPAPASEPPPPPSLPTPEPTHG